MAIEKDQRQINREWVESFRGDFKKQMNESLNSPKKPKKSINEAIGGFVGTPAVNNPFGVKTNKAPKIAEGYKSNITQKWATTKDMQMDLINFINDSYDASGDDLISDIERVINTVHNYIKSGKYEK